MSSSSFVLAFRLLGTATAVGAAAVTIVKSKPENRTQREGEKRTVKAIPVGWGERGLGGLVAARKREMVKKN